MKLAGFTANRRKPSQFIVTETFPADYKETDDTQQALKQSNSAANMFPSQPTELAFDTIGRK